MLNGIVKNGADGENVLYSAVNIRKEAQVEHLVSTVGSW